MHDLKYIRDFPEAFDQSLHKRGFEGSMSEAILDLDSQRRNAQTQAQTLLNKRNLLSKQVGEIKAKKGNADHLITEVLSLKEETANLEQLEQKLAQALQEKLETLPNLPQDDVPLGKDETANQEVRRWGTPSKHLAGLNTIAAHFELGEQLGQMDFELASKMSGARFVFLKGALAKLERSLASFMLDIHTNENDYTETLPPFLVRDQALYGTGQLPKFADDLFRTREGFWLIPTSEVPLTNSVADSILDESELPIRYTAWTPCFRSEAGAAGRDTRGMIRQHQFSKVEMVSIVHPDHSIAELERMTACAEKILQRLELPYRVMLLSSGDMGFAAQKTYDLEVWLPAQGCYREISSCSNCGTFQARRMQARFRSNGEKGTKFVHTLNGSGLAVGRTMVAIMENYQQEDGSIHIPKALQPYMGMDVIKPIAAKSDK